MPAGEAFDWLVQWFASQCNGDWEHSDRIHIQTIDNPGWTLKVRILETSLESAQFETVEHDYQSDVSWWRCWVEDGYFNAACGARDLASVIDVFRQWAVKSLQ